MLNKANYENESKLPVFFISDDKKKIKTDMPKLYKMGKLLLLNELDSFNFIAQSSNVILSDSSFSFTASYLGPKKTIYFKRFTNILNNGTNNHKWIKL